MRTIQMLIWKTVALIVMSLIPFVAGAGRTFLPEASLLWLEQHDTLKVGVYDSAWPPFEEIVDDAVVGLGPDTLGAAIAGQRLHIRYQRYANWEQVQDAACRGEVDVVMNVALSTDRSDCLLFTAAYAQAERAVVGRHGDLRASNDPDMAGLRVVTEQGFLTGQELRRRFPAARLQTVTTTAQALRQVAEGQADYYIGSAYVASHLIDRLDLKGIELQRPSVLPPEALRFGVPNRHVALLPILNQGLLAMPAAQRAALAGRWLRVPVWSGPARQVLDEAEQRVLAMPLRLGFAPDAAPLSFAASDGTPSGLAGAYVEQLRLAGASLLPQPSHDWYDLRENMRRETLDVVIGIPADSAWLGEGWVFSQPFITVPNVIVTGPASGTVLATADLSGKRILLSDPERLRAQVLQQAPGARIIPARGTEQALQRLLDGEADAYIGNLALVDRLLRERFPGQLQVAAPAGFTDALALAVRRPYAPLATRFDALLRQMSQAQHAALRSDWLSAQYSTGNDWRGLLRWLLPLLLVLSIAGWVHVLGHRRLRREVRDRQALEKRLQEVTGNLPAVVYQMRRSADGTLVFPYVAGQLPVLFGIEAGQAMASSDCLLERIDVDDRATLLQAIEQAARSFVALSCEVRVRGVEPTRWMHTRAQPYATENGTVTWSGYWVDVSDSRARADAFIEAKGVAEQAAEAKAQFLAMMSHEIRTPMVGVLGMLEMLERAPLPAAQRQHVEDAQHAARQLRHMLDAILDYARIDAGALQLQPLPLPLRPLLRGLGKAHAARAAAAGLSLQVEIDPALAPAHEVDGQRLQQLLDNLLDNALQATRQGGVVLSVLVLESPFPSLQVVRMQVIDTGPGIALPQREQLFQPRVHADGTGAGERRGIGLGLAISQRLLQMMGSQLQLHGEAGRGTRAEFTLSLPVACEEDLAATAPGAPPVTPLPPGLTGARVLVVDDHPAAQAMLAWRLQTLGATCVAVDDGSQGLDRLASERFDLVISDCRMPGVDGYAFTRLLREREGRQGARRLPVVGLTASVRTQDLQRGLDAGMDEVLSKPLSLAQLRDCLLRRLPGDHMPE